MLPQIGWSWVDVDESTRRHVRSLLNRAWVLVAREPPAAASLSDEFVGPKARPAASPSLLISYQYHHM